MLLKKIVFLVACVFTLCSGAVIPNVTALEPYANNANNTSVKAIDLSVCGTAIAKYTVELLKFSWDTGHAKFKQDATQCVDNLRRASVCSVPKERVGQTNVGSCYCAYGMGIDVNWEDFMSGADGGIFPNMRSAIQGVFFGAYNIESFCGRNNYQSLVVSCAGNTVNERVRECRNGNWSPAQNLVGKLKATVHLTVRDPDTPAPCEIRPPYCNRIP
ncbi:hypothetical protein FBU30_001804 [Linnemannia zychae]|nr:hypothetical protein FBU30_001804 [Linnemannia zychae]